jgi:hypothetical protein
MALTTTPPAGYKPDPNVPSGFVPLFQEDGTLFGYRDPNGVTVQTYDNLGNAQKQDDGSIIYTGTNGVVRTTFPDGTSTVYAGGLTKHVAATDNGLGGTGTATTKNDGTAATPDEIANVNNTVNGTIGNGGLLGLGGSGFSGVGDALKGLVNQAGAPAGQTGGSSPTTTTGGGTTGGVAGASKNLSMFDPFKAPAPRTAPVVSAPATVTPTEVRAPAGPVAPPSIDFNTGLVTAGHIDSAPTAGAAPVVSAPQLGPSPQISAGSVSAGSIRGTTQMIDPNQTAAPVGDIQAGGIGRDAQVNALGQLNDIATGKTKTAADWLLQKGIDQNVGAAYGLAASLQGRNPGVALRTGAITAKDAIAKSAADVAAQKAAEQQQAAKDYATLGSTIAGQDLDALKSNQTKDLQLSVTNLNAKIEVLKGNQQTQLEEGKADLAAQTATSIANLQAQTTTAVANLQASTARDIANQTAQLDASKANAANQVAIQISDAANQLAVLKANLEAQTSANNTNAAITTQKQIAELEAQTKVLTQYQDQLYDAAKTTAANKLAADTANATNKLAADTSSASLAERTQADNDAQDARLKQLGLDALIAQLNAATAAATTQAQKDAANQAFYGKLLELGGTAVANYYTGGGYSAIKNSQNNSGPTTSGVTYGANGAPILD